MHILDCLCFWAKGTLMIYGTHHHRYLPTMVLETFWGSTLVALCVTSASIFTCHVSSMGRIITFLRTKRGKIEKFRGSVATPFAKSRVLLPCLYYVLDMQNAFLHQVLQDHQGRGMNHKYVSLLHGNEHDFCGQEGCMPCCLGTAT